MALAAKSWWECWLRGHKEERRCPPGPSPGGKGVDLGSWNQKKTMATVVFMWVLQKQSLRQGRDSKQLTGDVVLGNSGRRWGRQT